MTLRIRLAGPLEVCAGATRLGPGDFPGRQGRLVFAALVRARRPVDRDELAEMLWPNELPASWTRDLSAIVSKLRALLRGVATFSTGGGRWYAIDLPADVTVDIEDAIALVEQAEKREGDAAAAAVRGALLLAEPFLPGDECAWVDECRTELRALLARALVVQAECLIDAADAGAVRPADALVALEPDQERSHLLLVRAHLAANDRVGALRAYDALRRRMADTFGLSPSAEAESLLRVALGSETEMPIAIIEATRGPVVGRERDLLKLRLLLDPSSPVRVALIVGEPGIGKSRLAAEIAAEAHSAGFEVELGDAESVAPDRRVLVVVEDVHALDRDQVARLQRLVDHAAGVRIVATARTPDVEHAPVQSWIADLRARDVVMTVALTGLDERDVAAMLGGRAEFAAMVRRSTGGNPL
ncbi:MAG TPA: AAA family ATPase, partial [Acidimicrobiia bacterium]|nr:AAA family ATPase [Acidimicrobiia bacterium]